MQSKLQQLGQVQFPEFTGERIYMLPFTKQNGLPEQYSRWQKTVDQLVASIDTDQTMFLMVDQGFVRAGNSHRRGGVHIDGNWVQGTGRWDTGGGRWNTRMGRHDTHSFTMKEEGLILASDVRGCDAYVGEWHDTIGERGDCSHVDLRNLDRVNLQANQAYIGNVSMLHESIPVKADTRRTVVRINVPEFTF